MNPARLALAEAAPPGVQLISGPGRAEYARGNLIFRTREGGRELILKVYRRRKNAWSEFWSNVSQRWFEHKEGIRPDQRCRTEAAVLAAWRAAGFDVPRIVPWERPRWLGAHPALAMEYVAGETLLDMLRDEALSEAEKKALIARLGREHGRRHRVALESGDPLLVQEHPATQHVLVTPERLVTFDFEHAYRADFPLPVAVAYELAATLRALWLDDVRFEEPFIDEFLAAYDQPQIVRDSCRLFRSQSLHWRLYRRRDRRHRGERSKSMTMERIAGRFGA